jgi:integrase
MRRKTEGFHTWSTEEIKAFEAHWPIGTRQRLAFAILLYTGLRRGDATKLGSQHIRNDVISMMTEKTNTPIDIPVFPELKKIIEASPVGKSSLIACMNGKPMNKCSFGNWFKDACKAAGVPGSAHGLRKAGATHAAECGATEKQLEAFFGWTGGKMAALYTQRANRARLAQSFMQTVLKNET